MNDIILELKNITKIYDNGIVANKNINFNLKKGEIHAIAGENGAGKSTLMKILFGMQQPTEGEIYYKNEKITIDTPSKAIDLEIGMVHQHFMLVPSFTVAQNMILGIEPSKGSKIDYKKANDMIIELSEKYNLNVDPNEVVENLSVGMKQKVEILKALLRGAKILILDEPTAVLTPQETDELFEQFKLLKKNGHTIIFISHKLKEVKQICDRITIIRKGQSQGVFNVSAVSEKEISNLMVGRDIILKYNKSTINSNKILLKVKNINYLKRKKKVLDDINFTVSQGQILGIAGVEGNGQSELIEIIAGLESNFEGNINFLNTDVTNSNIKTLRDMGLSYIPEDRMTKGIAKDASILENIIGTIFDKSSIKRGLFINSKKTTHISKEKIAEYDIVCKNHKQSIGSLSGGNIQKVVVARECSIGPKVLIAEQPTRGVDVGAAHFIHNELLKLRTNNTGIILASADLNEILELSDSIIVMYEGKISAFIKDPKKITEKDLGLYMLGVNTQSDAEIKEAFNESRI